MSRPEKIRSTASADALCQYTKLAGGRRSGAPPKGRGVHEANLANRRKGGTETAHTHMHPGCATWDWGGGGRDAYVGEIRRSAGSSGPMAALVRAAVWLSDVKRQEKHASARPD